MLRKLFSRGITMLCALILMLVSAPAANATLTGALTDSTIGISSADTNGTKSGGDTLYKAMEAAWTASGTEISGTVTPGSYSKNSWGSTKYYPDKSAQTVLTLTNNSGEDAILSFNYTKPGNNGTISFSANVTATDNAAFAELAAGASVTVTLTTASSTSKDTDSNIHTSYKAATELTNIALVSKTADLTITLLESVGGSYTASDGKETKSSGSFVNPMDTTYSFTAAAPEANYRFDGWYFNGQKYSNTSMSISGVKFTADTTVKAGYAEDPLYAMTTIPSDSEFTKDQLVGIDSDYYHDTTSKLVADGSMPVNNSAYSVTAASKTKDKIDVQYIPSQPWSDSMSISYSGEAGGDYASGGGQRTTAHARIQSDIIRVYAKEDCNISFDYKNDLSVSGGTKEDSAAGIYYYITTASSATAAKVKTGTALTGSGSSGTIALSKGNYLYILAEGYAKYSKTMVIVLSQFTMDFSYSASISNFSVSYNEKRDTLNVGFRDNVGTALGSGTVVVNDTSRAIGSDGNMAAMEFADLSNVTLKVGTVPSGYTHIGWAITSAGGSTTYQYTETYSRTLKEDVSVTALFVPQMTITMGTNGYSDATYALTSTGAAASGQYVARNADSTAFYTSLADAFASTDTVVLLASATINGNWEIPTGKTFVVPFGLTDRGSTTPVITASTIAGNYCLVKLNGDLTVNGTLLVSARQYRNSGACGGPLGHLSLSSAARITVNGTLYAYGPVTGSGSITANSGADVHEYVEFQDNRAVGYINNIYTAKNEKHVFPFNTLFVKNIEALVTYENGSTLTGHVALTYDTVSTAEIPVIGTSGAMLNSTSGSITKYYDSSAGQFVIQIDGTVESGSFEITLSVTVAGTTMDITMKTSDFYVPLSAPFHFDVVGSLTLNDNYKFLPGSTMDVKKGGTLTIASGSNIVFYRMNDYDNRGIHVGSTEQWGYGQRAYPANPTHFTGVSYAYSFNAANVGSAKLNVDGTLIVKGGLYVTDDLQTDTANGIVIRDNGYNYLTGSGVIDMTEAKNNVTSIYEASHS